MRTSSPVSTASQRPMLTSTRAASILFGPHLYSRYLDWQTNIDSPDEAAFYTSREKWKLVRDSISTAAIGHLPSPEHFRGFMKRMGVELHARDEQTDDSSVNCQDGTTASDLALAELCRHTIHPGSPCQTVTACPVCIMSQCISSL